MNNNKVDQSAMMHIAHPFCSLILPVCKNSFSHDTGHMSFLKVPLEITDLCYMVRRKDDTRKSHVKLHILVIRLRNGLDDL